MPHRAKQRYDRLNTAFPILHYYAKHRAVGGLSAEQAIGALALFLEHKPLVCSLLTTYQGGRVHGTTKLLEELFNPRERGPYETAELLEETRRALAPVEILPDRRGFAFEDEERLRVEIRPTRPDDPRFCSWRLECHERNENITALRDMGECLRRVLEGELLSITGKKLLFV